MLQDNVPHKDIDSVRATIEDSYGRPMEEIFSSFDAEPLGAASIGQVHRAVLLESAKELKKNKSSKWSKLLPWYEDESVDTTHVVVKIQYPEVEARFGDDVKTITSFCKIAQPEHVKALHEIRRQFLSEFDYRLEAANLKSVRDNLAIPFPNVRYDL